MGQEHPPRTLYTATDLLSFLSCAHRAVLDARRQEGSIPEPPPDPILESLDLHGKGMAHQKAVRDALETAYGEVYELPSVGPVADSEATLKLMRDGVPVIAQGTIVESPWLGKPDFLIRVEGESQLGPYHYEPVEAKLSRHVRGDAVTQLTFYALLLESAQGVLPHHLRLALGDGNDEELNTRDYQAYVREGRQRFRDWLAAEHHDSYPDPIEACPTCPWLPTCETERRQDDHLIFVGGIHRGDVPKLQTAGVSTLTQLAEWPAHHSIVGIGPDKLQRYIRQAQLQRLRREDGQDRYEVLHREALEALPLPSPHDLFFDVETNPYEPGGPLTYLWSWVTGNKPQALRYHYGVSHTHEAQRPALDKFLQEILSAHERHPDLHVYHYGAHDAARLLELSSSLSTREADLNRLIDAGVFVDLAQIVRRGLLTSCESYELKDLEVFYEELVVPRSGPVVDSALSILFYNQWKLGQDQALWDHVLHFSELETLSSWALRQWLERVRQENSVTERRRPVHYQGLETPLADPIATIKSRLAASPLPELNLLDQLLVFHRRETRLQWLLHRERLNATNEELHEDTEAIHGLTLTGTVPGDYGNIWRQYRFDPSQDFKIAAGDSVMDPATGSKAGTVTALDPVAGTLTLNPIPGTPDPSSLTPGEPFNGGFHQQALHRVATDLLEKGQQYGAARALLFREPPRLRRGTFPALADQLDEGVDLATTAAPHLDASCLAVQGPPGTGKTYLGGQVVAALLRAGRRVGITALSHKVIGNLLTSVSEAMGPTAWHAIQKAEAHQAVSLEPVTRTTSNREVADQLKCGRVNVVAGTTWLFSRPELDHKLDVLVVDEAGQLSLADVLAASTSASNLVLLGDPRQLEQPVLASHPDGADVSALEHFLHGHLTMPKHLGVFLPETRRMHPDITRFISALAYEGRLTSMPGLDRQHVKGPLGTMAGLRYVPTPHVGNRSTSLEEAHIVQRLVADLIRGQWVDKVYQRHPLQLQDILVVAPFNAQVHLLAQLLPKGSRVGTVDKFQGQEAPVVIYSMAASTAELASHGGEFLYSINRLNVAISRARALAILVANPALLRARPSDPEQVKLVNALCLLVGEAQPLDLPLALSPSPKHRRPG